MLDFLAKQNHCSTFSFISEILREGEFCDLKVPGVALPAPHRDHHNPYTVKICPSETDILISLIIEEYSQTDMLGTTHLVKREEKCRTVSNRA